MLYGYPHYSQEIVGEGDHRAPLCYRLTPCRFHVRRLLGYIVRHALRILQAGGADVNKADIWNRSMNAAFRKSQRQNGVELIATLRFPKQTRIGYSIPGNSIISHHSRHCNVAKRVWKNVEKIRVFPSVCAATQNRRIQRNTRVYITEWQSERSDKNSERSECLEVGKADIRTGTRCHVEKSVKPTREPAHAEKSAKLTLEPVRIQAGNVVQHSAF